MFARLNGAIDLADPGESGDKPQHSSDANDIGDGMAATKRIGNIDIVRGVAASSVMLEHAMEHAGIIDAGANGFATNWINLGEVGVVAFFLVSGFVIPLSLERWNDLARFWVSRILRIYPLYLAVFAVSWIVTQTYMGPKAIAAQMLFASGYVGTANLVGNSWTLSLEAIWYVGFTCLFLTKLNSKPFVITALTALMVMLGAAACIKGHHVPMGRVGMVATCVVGLFAYRVSHGHSVRTYSLCAVFLMAVITIGLCAGFIGKHEMTPDAPSLRTVLLSWAAAYTIFIGSFFVAISKSIGRPLIFLGEISYSVYLVHTFALWGMTRAGLSGVGYVAAVVIITIAASALTFRFIETPAIHLSHRYPRRNAPAISREAI